MTPSRGRGALKARRTQPSRIVAHARTDEGGVLAVRRPKSGGRTPRGGRLRRPQPAVFVRWVLAASCAKTGSYQGLIRPRALVSSRSSRSRLPATQLKTHLFSPPLT